MDGVSREELKQVGQMLLVVLPLMIGLAVFMFNSPMYHDMQATKRAIAQSYLLKQYTLSDERDSIIDRYGFTDDEVDPIKLLRKWQEER